MTGRLIHNDPRGVVSELAFGRHAFITPHTNPNMTLFVIISGGGFVQVGEERARVNHGEAIVWPSDVLHGAYTDGSEMRAIVIELPDRNGAPLVVDGIATSALGPGAGSTSEADPTPASTGSTGSTEAGRPTPTRADGRLADRPGSREDHDETEGEPW